MTIESRPWGHYEVIKETPGFKVKILTLHPGQQISLQYHKHRRELWTVLEGKGKAQLGVKEFDLSPQEIFMIPQGAIHRLSNPFEEPFLVLEAAWGDPIDEGDIVRIADDYGRA